MPQHRAPKKNLPSIPLDKKMLVPPTDLPPRAKGCWARLARPLYETGRLTVLDLEAFKALCQTWDLWEGALADVTGSAEKKGYLLQRLNVCGRLLNQNLSNFGLSPLSRIRAGVSAPAAKESAFAEFDK